MARLVVDPITRIEGHLRIEAVVENGTITDAYSAGTMVRGFEKILKGRDPRDAWAFTERACGVCTTVHALARVRTVEDALGITVPAQRRADPQPDVLHAVRAGPRRAFLPSARARLGGRRQRARRPTRRRRRRWRTSISTVAEEFARLFRGLQKRLTAFVESGQLGIFANGYWGHPAYKLPPEVNLMAVAHYLEALEWQKEIVKIHTIFGGKNPHPNYLVGGVPCSINLNEVNAINTERLAITWAVCSNQAMTFVEQVYIPDLMAIARSTWTGPASAAAWRTTWLTATCRPTATATRRTSSSRAARFSTATSPKCYPVERPGRRGDQGIHHAFLVQLRGRRRSRPASLGRRDRSSTTPGPKPPYEQLDVEGKYSWLKTPRWKDHAMEVGPLARLLVAYATGNTEVKDVVNEALGQLGVPVAALFSTLGRTAARGLETTPHRPLDEGVLRRAHRRNIKAGDTRTFNREKWEPSTWPADARGRRHERGAARRAWRTGSSSRTARSTTTSSSCPSTWNASPRDAKGQRSAYEAALIGTPLANPRAAARDPAHRSTRSIRASPAPCTCTIPTASTSTGSQFY